jgi:hypothetical protein
MDERNPQMRRERYGRILVGLESRLLMRLHREELAEVGTMGECEAGAEGDRLSVEGGRLCHSSRRGL